MRDTWAACPDCKGGGEVEVRAEAYVGIDLAECRRCDGTGAVNVVTLSDEEGRT